MKLGAILVQIGAISGDQLAAALRHQVVYGGRLGSNLVELGGPSVDDIAQALSRQHRVPAALTRHFERRDREVVGLIDRDLAARHQVVPIAWANLAAGRALVVCMRDPGDAAARAAVDQAIGQPLLIAVAAELALAFWVEQCYGVARPARLAFARAGGAAPLPGSATDPRPVALDPDAIDIDVDEEVDMPGRLELVALDDQEVEKDHSQYGFDPRRPALTLPPRPSQRIPLPPTPAPEPAPSLAAAPALDLDTARARIAACSDRDQVTAVLLDFMRSRFPVGLILVARDDLALGEAGFGGAFDAASVESVVVPLAQPSLFRTARDTVRTFRGPPPADGRAVQERFFKLFPPGTAPADVAVVPVVVRDRAVCLCYGHTRGRLDDHAVAQLGLLAVAAGDAFVRLIRARRGATQS